MFPLEMMTKTQTSSKLPHVLGVKQLQKREELKALKFQKTEGHLEES